MNCILLHGLGQNNTSWQETIKTLDKSLKVNCPNLFELCQNVINYNNLFRAFSEYCKQFSEPFNLCGLSLGGILALDYTIRNPQMVNSLVLIGAQYRMPTNLLKLQNIIFKLMPQKTFEKIGLTKQSTITLMKSMATLNFESGVPNIECPTLILCGQQDKANKKAAIKLNDLIKNSKFQIIPKAGHEVNVDTPQQLAKILNNFYLENSGN